MDYLLELGVEEFPAEYVESTKEQLIEGFENEFQERSLKWASFDVESTPRRFACLIKGIEQVDEETVEKVKGPSKEVAYKDGKASKALMGFMKSKGIGEEDIFFEEVKGSEYVFSYIKKKKDPIEKQLKEMLPKIIRSLSFPRSMRWGGKNLRFARPLRWIVSLLDDEILYFDLEGISCDRYTKGHRVLGSDRIYIDKIENYEELLKENGVILKEKDRRDIIIKGINRLAREKGGHVLEDEDLLEEIVNIVEYPTPFMGNIVESFLDLPKEVIITSMKDNQRYFPVLDDDEKLMPYFISVRNGDKEGLENVIMGNEKVLSPRLEDAEFFYNNDLKKDPDQLLEELKSVTFHEKLGSMYQKTMRLLKLVQEFGNDLSVGEETIENAKRAAKYCKCDLNTSMVDEFPELQGTMGMIYAQKAGESPQVSQAIYEHYLPRYAKDDLPESTSGTILALADKMDSLCGLYAVGVRVTGSQDPYALRRAALGLINIILDSDFNLSLNEMIRESLYTYAEEGDLTFDYNNTSQDVSDFIMQRYRNLLIDRGFSYDRVDAVLSTSSDDLSDIYSKLEDLSAWLDRDGSDQALVSFVRLENISSKGMSTEIFADLIEEDEEREMLYLVDKSDQAEDLIDSGKYLDALEFFASTIEIVDEFLDNCMIMVDDDKIRNNRLALLKKWYTLISRIFIPNKIVR